MLSVESKRDFFLGVLVWNGVQTGLYLRRDCEGKCYVVRDVKPVNNGFVCWHLSYGSLPQKYYDFYDEFGGGTDKSKLEEDLIKAGYLK